MACGCATRGTPASARPRKLRPGEATQVRADPLCLLPRARHHRRRQPARALAGDGPEAGAPAPRAAPGVKALAWVYAGNAAAAGPVNLADACVRRKMAAEARWLTETCGFDGVQWDYEYCRSDDAGLLALLRETRAASLAGSSSAWPRPYGCPTPSARPPEAGARRTSARSRRPATKSPSCATTRAPTCRARMSGWCASRPGACPPPSRTEIPPAACSWASPHTKRAAPRITPTPRTSRWPSRACARASRKAPEPHRFRGGGAVRGLHHGQPGVGRV